MYITKRGTILLDKALPKWLDLMDEGEIITKEDREYEINLAGTDKKDISIQIEEDQIRIYVKEQFKKYANIYDYDDSENITAKYKDGLLTISIPKKQKEKRVIEIE